MWTVFYHGSRGLSSGMSPCHPLISFHFLEMLKQPQKRKYEIYINLPPLNQPSAMPPPLKKKKHGHSPGKSSALQTTSRATSVFRGNFWGDGHFVARRSWIGGTSVWQKKSWKNQREDRGHFNHLKDGDTFWMMIFYLTIKHGETHKPGIIKLDPSWGESNNGNLW